MAGGFAATTSSEPVGRVGVDGGVDNSLRSGVASVAAAGTDRTSLAILTAI
jgi:hypothetical protein